MRRTARPEAHGMRLTGLEAGALGSGVEAEPGIADARRADVAAAPAVAGILVRTRRTGCRRSRSSRRQRLRRRSSAAGGPIRTRRAGLRWWRHSSRVRRLPEKSPSQRESRRGCPWGIGRAPGYNPSHRPGPRRPPRSRTSGRNRRKTAGRRARCSWFRSSCRWRGCSRRHRRTGSRVLPVCTQSASTRWRCRRYLRGRRRRRRVRAPERPRRRRSRSRRRRLRPAGSGCHSRRSWRHPCRCRRSSVAALGQEAAGHRADVGVAVGLGGGAGVERQAEPLRAPFGRAARVSALSTVGGIGHEVGAACGAAPVRGVLSPVRQAVRPRRVGSAGGRKADAAVVVGNGRSRRAGLAVGPDADSQRARLSRRAVPGANAAVRRVGLGIDASA